MVAEIQCYIDYWYSGTLLLLLVAVNDVICCDVVVVMVIFWVDRYYHGGVEVMTDPQEEYKRSCFAVLS